MEGDELGSSTWELLVTMIDLDIMFQHHWQIKSMDNRAVVLSIFQGLLTSINYQSPNKDPEAIQEPLV